MMNNKNIICSICTYFFINSALALPILSEPNDIVSVKSNIVYITNSNDGSILQCNVVDHHLQNCDTKSTGMTAPFRIAVVSRVDNSQRLYITKKDTNTIYSLITDTDGDIKNNPSLEEIKLQSNETDSSIIHIIPSQNKTKTTRRFYISRASENNENYGQFLYADLNADKAKIEKQELYNNINLPAFYIKPVGSSDREEIYGVGRISGKSGLESIRYPFFGAIRTDNAHFITEISTGGTEESTDSSVESDVASIAEVDGKYWITYKGPRKFTRYDHLPSAKTDNNMYTAPSDSNVNLKNITSIKNMHSETNSFATFSDSNKIGICSGSDDFTCTDAFQYLSYNAYLNNDNAPEHDTITINSHYDHGWVVFKNLNYSPINQDEVIKNIRIPESLAEVFSGSCMEKQDFSSKNRDETIGNQSCSLYFDFRRLTNQQPITESFDVGFTVHGPFGDVPTQVRFNIDHLPASTPQLYLQDRAGNIINQLYLNSGDFDYFRVVYIGREDQASIKVNLRIIEDGLPGRSIRSFFYGSCFSEFNRPSPVLGESAGLRRDCQAFYYIPASSQDRKFQIKIDHVGSEPSYLPDDTLNVYVTASAKVISSFTDSEAFESLGLYHITLQPGESEDIRYTNIGSVTSHNFRVSLVTTRLDKYMSGDCWSGVDIEPMMSCVLHIDLPLDSTLSGQYYLHSQDDAGPRGDLTATDLPLTIGHKNITGNLSIEDSNYIDPIGFSDTLYQLNLAKQTIGGMIITNSTSLDIPDLTITLPLLSIIPTSQDFMRELNINESIFNLDGGDNGIPSCITSTVSGSTSIISLATHEQCVIHYKINPDMDITPQDTQILLTYFNNTIRKTKQIHFTNQPATLVSENGSDTPLQQISIDASTPTRTFIVTNNLGYDIKGLNIEAADEITQVFDASNCQHILLHPNDSCDITVRLDDNKEQLGQHSIIISADNLIDRPISLHFTEALTDQVEIDNRGGYLMNVGYIGRHLNTDGSDPICDANSSCYGNTETGVFSNPYNRVVDSVSGRDINFYIVAGYTRTLPSCDGGKIVCTQATVNPVCRYYSDGTNAQNAQNQCANSNP